MPVVNIVLPPGYEEGTFAPSFDPGRTNSNNIVPQELHELSAAFGTEQQFLVPAYAPFFEEGMIIERDAAAPMRDGPAITVQLSH